MDEHAVYHKNSYGVCFRDNDGKLSLLASSCEPMNGVNAGESWIGGAYNIPADENGNSILTGDGGMNNCRYFTCVELEVF